MPFNVPSSQQVVPTPSLIFIPCYTAQGVYWYVCSSRLYFYLFSFPPRFLTANLFTNCKAKLQWMYFLHFYLFIIFYFKYIHVPTINQVFSFILWLDHHSVSFLLLAPIMGLSWSFGPRQLKTTPSILWLLQLLLLWLLPSLHHHWLPPGSTSPSTHPGSCFHFFLQYSNQCSGFVSISFLNSIPQGEIKSLNLTSVREQVPVWFQCHHLVTFTASLS